MPPSSLAVPATLHASLLGRLDRLGQCLQPGGEVWRLADHAALLRRTGADQIADDDQAAGNR